MMGAVAGLGFAIGFILLLRGLFTARAPEDAPPSDWRPSLRTAGQCVACGLVASCLTLLLLGIPAVSLLSGLAAGFAPVALQRQRRKRLLHAQHSAWPDAVDDLLAAVRAGVPLSEAICEAAVSGPEPLRPGFAAYARAWRRGASFTGALAVMQKHFADPSADRVAVSLALSIRAGGSNVGRVLATQGDFLRADLRMRGEIDARQSWTVNGARVAVAAPWFALAALSIRSDAAHAYASPAGAVVLLAAAVIGALAYWTMTRIAALPQAQRLPEISA